MRKRSPRRFAIAMIFGLLYLLAMIFVVSRPSIYRVGPATFRAYCQANALDFRLYNWSDAGTTVGYSYMDYERSRDADPAVYRVIEPWIGQPWVKVR